MTPPEPRATAPESFAEAVAFLQRHGEVITLSAATGGVIAVSPDYQGRVMTSAVGPASPSLGFINRSFIESQKSGTQFDNFGGEDRFWLGPEGGQFALYFPKGAPFEFEHWQTPAAFQQGRWEVVEQDDQHVTFTRAMQLPNYSGAEFSLRVTRTVRLLDQGKLNDLLGVSADALTALEWVGFETENRIQNTGTSAWTRQTGAPSIWILGMYNPAPDTWVIVPFDPSGDGPVVNDSYFGKVPAERLVTLQSGALLFQCDGEYRSKIGLSPGRAKPFAGSYSASSNLLSLVHFDRDADATDYVNSMWELQKEPFGGDVVNSYNDGPVEPGKPALGGFYELETSSPAAFLGPGESMKHTHRTVHFVGQPAVLDALAQRALGVSLRTVRATVPDEN